MDDMCFDWLCFEIWCWFVNGEWGWIVVVLGGIWDCLFFVLMVGCMCEDVIFCDMVYYFLCCFDMLLVVFELIVSDEELVVLLEMCIVCVFMLFGCVIGVFD